MNNRHKFLSSAHLFQLPTKSGPTIIASFFGDVYNHKLRICISKSFIVERVYNSHIVYQNEPVKYIRKILDIMRVINCKDYKNMCQNYKEVTYNGYHASFNSLKIAVTKASVNTTRRCDLTSVLYGLIFDTA